MNKPETSIERHRAKREAVYEAAATVFAQYGFRRTTMNDIAQAAGISRPALYLMFANKENLFQGLAAFRLDQAIEQALDVLAGGGDTNERVIEALLVFERIFYEPIADSPHGAELMDISQSLASELMMKDIVRLHAALAKTLSDAEQAGEVNFDQLLHAQLPAAPAQHAQGFEAEVAVVLRCGQRQSSPVEVVAGCAASPHLQQHRVGPLPDQCPQR